MRKKEGWRRGHSSILRQEPDRMRRENAADCLVLPRSTEFKMDKLPNKNFDCLVLPSKRVQKSSRLSV